MSDTPRTDAMFKKHRREWGTDTWSLRDDVESLERELADAQEDAANQRRLADLALAHRDEIIKERDILELELFEMRERCEKLRKERDTLVRAFNSRGY